MSEKIWLKNYPQGVPHDINPDQYPNLLSLLKESFKRFGNKPAYTNMGKSISYKQTDELSDAFGAFLQKNLALKPGDRIAIMMPNCLQYPVVLFGALKAGLIVVNTNPLYTPREMQHQFHDADVKAIVIIENFAHHLEEVLGDTHIKHIITTQLGDLFGFPKKMIVNTVVKYVKKMVPKFNLPTAVSFTQALSEGRKLSIKVHEAKPDDIAMLQYTGGTTGVSKGAMLTHKNITSNMEQISAWLSSADFKEGAELGVTALPLYHIFAFTVNCLVLFKHGAHNVLITNPRDMPAFIADLKKYPFTLLTGVNTLFNGLLAQEEFKAVDFSHLKVTIGGGMAVQRFVAEKWEEVTGTILGEGYGLTEASPVLTIHPLDGTGEQGTIGLPVPSTELKIVNDEGIEVALGERGEIIAKGPQVMLGYLNRPEATKEVIKDGWLYTGDIGIMHTNGAIKIVDRKKDMILVSGFNVFPNEVEDVVAMHKDVVEVAAIGIPDPKSTEAVKIFVVRNNPNLTVEELREHCKELLTGYKVPRHVEFKDELPKSNVGKILRRVLKEEELAKKAN